jgi:hypothetical protein
MQSDPIGLASGTYNYVGFNSLNATDPLGLASSLLDDITNFAAGLGDSASYGGTKAWRDFLNIGSVDYSSGSYAAGSYTDVGMGLLSFGGSKVLNKLADPFREQITQQCEKLEVKLMNFLIIKI